MCKSDNCLLPSLLDSEWIAVNADDMTPPEAGYSIVVEGTILHRCQIHHGGLVPRAKSNEIFIHIYTYLIYVQIFLRIKKGRWNWRNLKMLIRKRKESNQSSGQYGVRICVHLCLHFVKVETGDSQIVPDWLKWILSPKPWKYVKVWYGRRAPLWSTLIGPPCRVLWPGPGSQRFGIWCQDSKVSLHRSGSFYYHWVNQQKFPSQNRERERDRERKKEEMREQFHFLFQGIWHWFRFFPCKEVLQSLESYSGR